MTVPLDPPPSSRIRRPVGGRYAVALAATVTVMAVRYRRGRATRLLGLVRRLEDRTGFPAWASIGIAYWVQVSWV